MGTRTALNTPYNGVVESQSVPAALHPRPGRDPYATHGSVTPIHCCEPDLLKDYANKTHHYCDIFSEQLLAPLGELAYVRLDEDKVEKVFINRSKRILIASSDGALAQWRAAPSFESLNQYVAGTPLVDARGALVSVVTARRGNHYAVSNFEGIGGYFDTPLPWKMIDPPVGAAVYGDRWFESRDELREYITTLPTEYDLGPATPVLVRSTPPRLALLSPSGRQITHTYLSGVAADDVIYL